nr:hypothetical protein [Desulfobacterales bacterium]
MLRGTERLFFDLIYYPREVKQWLDIVITEVLVNFVRERMERGLPGVCRYLTGLQLWGKSRVMGGTRRFLRSGRSGRPSENPADW